MTKNKKIKIGVIGGSGLDDPKIIKKFQKKTVKTPYGNPSSKLVCGKIGDVDVVILSRHGKKHTIMPTNVPYRSNIWALKKMECTHIIATTACGSLREKFKPGDIIFIDQFIDNTKHRILTFYEDKLIHTPMANPFNYELREKLVKSAKKEKIRYHKRGTMITIEGPRFSTKAESHMFRNWGADLINMSTVPEVILANELGIPYQSIAMSTDYDCWKEDEDPVSFEMVMETMNKNADKVKKIIIDFIKNF